MRPSYTTNSDRRHGNRLRSLALTVVASAIALAVFDQALGYFFEHVIQDIPWVVPGQERNGLSIENLWHLNDQTVQPIVFTGSSQMQNAFSPHLFDSYVKPLTTQEVTSVNVSIEGSATVMARDVIEGLIIPARPRMILYGIEMRALNTSSDSYLQLFRESLLGEALSLPPGPAKDALIWLNRHSGLVRYRNIIREWFSTGVFKTDVREVDNRGFFNLDAKVGRSDKVIREQFLPFAPGDAQIAALENIARQCQQAGIPCILINMPLSDAAYQYIPSDAKANYQEFLKVKAAALQLPIWDFDTSACRMALGDASFYDVTHLNAKGAPQFTRMVADVYARQILNAEGPTAQSCAEITLP